MKAKVGRGSSFRGILDYALSKDEGLIVGGNMSGQDPRQLAAEFGTFRALRPDVDRPVWHASFALAPGEKLDEFRWSQIADAIHEGMDFSPDAPFVAIRHLAGEDQNTPIGKGPTTEHIHFIASRIDDEGKLWHGQWEVRKAIELTQKLEKEFGLIQTKGLDAERPQKKKASKAEIERSERLGETPARVQLQDKVGAAIAGGATIKEFVERLHASGVNVRPNLASTGKMNGFSFELDGVAMKGSDLGKAYTFSGLQKSGLDYSQARDTAFLAALTTLPLNQPRRAVSSSVAPVSDRATLPKIQKIGSLPIRLRTAVAPGVVKWARDAMHSIDQLAKALRRWQAQLDQSLAMHRHIQRAERERLAAQARASIDKRAALANAPAQVTATAVTSHAQPHDLDKLRHLVDLSIHGKGIKKSEALIRAASAGDAASIDKLLDAGAAASVRTLDSAAKSCDDTTLKKLIEACGNALDASSLRELSHKVSSPEARQRLEALAKHVTTHAESGNGSGVKSSGPRGPS